MKPRAPLPPRQRKRATLLPLRILARAGSCLVLAAALGLGIVRGGHLEYAGSPWPKLPGKLAGLIGLAADDVKISGLVNHEPDVVLAAIGVAPGAPLIGFDAGRARDELERLDWVAGAKVMRLFPNQLEVTVVERTPFAIWQRDGVHHVIDRGGAVISSISPGKLPGLLVVSGNGANTAVEGLLAALKPHEALRKEVKAAAMAGGRRWTLYLESGAAVALPEGGAEEGIRRFLAIEDATGIAAKGATRIDLRLPGRVAIAYPLPEEPLKKVKVSHKN